MCKINCKVRKPESSETAKFVLLFWSNFAVYTIFFRTKWTNFAVIFLDGYGVFLFCTRAELCSLFSIFPVKMDELCSIFLICSGQNGRTLQYFLLDGYGVFLGFFGPNLAVYLVFFQSKWTNFAVSAYKKILPSSSRMSELCSLQLQSLFTVKFTIKGRTFQL